ncbi:MAG: SlyX family protein [Fibrobacterota bacterium]
MDDKIISLETRIAFLENNLDEVNHTLFQQDRQLSALKNTVEKLNRQLKSIGRGDVRDLSEETPPPHY